MSYTLNYTDDALNDLKHLDKTIVRRILRKLERLAENAAIVTHYALSGDWSGYFRLRVGDYRVIYTIDHAVRIITIERVSHRSDVYNE